MKTKCNKNRNTPQIPKERKDTAGVNIPKAPMQPKPQPSKPAPKK